MDEWERFNESLPKKKELYSKLNMDNITDADYTHAKRVCKYHDLYLKSNTLVLAHAFEK